MPYVSNSGGRAGQTFVFPDGTKRVIANSYFVHAKLLDKATVLKFYYSFCEIDVSGERLNIIFDDITNGKMGTLSKDDDNAERYFSNPIITNITYISKDEQNEHES
jgi:hypothetical protein